MKKYQIESANNKIFAEQANFYDQQNYWRSDEDKLIEKYFINKTGKILVLGCGAGRTLPYLYDKGFDIIAIDILPEMVLLAQKKVVGKNITILQMDAKNLKFESNSFDYVFFPFHGIDCVYPDIYECVQEVKRVLKKNGVFIFNSHNRLYLRQLKNFFKGHYAQEISGIFVYRTFLLRELFYLKKYFKNVIFKHRITMQDNQNNNWKNRVYKFLAIFDRSIYYICLNPKKEYERS
jgi:ubiquinone/menaquinone biosynthesis C-methylase UbiE